MKFIMQLATIDAKIEAIRAQMKDRYIVDKQVSALARDMNNLKEQRKMLVRKVNRNMYRGTPHSAG
jgi:archaellum component FlaC